MTVGNKEEAVEIGKSLVTSRLAACVNIIDHMNSIYFWEGELQNDQEVVLIAKTTEKRLPELIEKVKSMHSYECPCIVSLPIVDGNQDFLGWIKDQVK